LNETRDAIRQQETHVNEAREVYVKTQTEYSAFRERLSGLRARLNVWHRQSSELHNQRESVSRDLAVLDERRRALVASQASLQSEMERSANEEKLAQERFSEIDQETANLQVEFDEAKNQLTRAQESLQTRQVERASAESALQTARDTVTSIHTQRAETQARLDELAARVESQKQRLTWFSRRFNLQKLKPEKAEQRLHEARPPVKMREMCFRKMEEEVKSKKGEAEKLEQERRAQIEERTNYQTRHSRMQAQLDILIQAEQSLAGYAEGARFLLDAARQSRLNARGALSAALDVPAEFETAIAAALGDTLDAVLLEADQIEEALRLLESDEAGRAALLPLNGNPGKLLDLPAMRIVSVLLPPSSMHPKIYAAQSSFCWVIRWSSAIGMQPGVCSAVSRLTPAS